MFRTLLFLTLIPTLADAIQPESGWWWNQAESGRGFTIEVQNNTLFMAGYLYDQSGAPVWYTASGPYDHTASSFTGQLVAFRGGQCLTCAYRPPSPDFTPGNVTLRFTGTTAGTLTWPGGTIPITRQLYGTTNDHRRLGGRWVYTSVLTTLASADWLVLDQTIVSNGTPYVAGTIQGGRAAIGGFLTGEYSILIDASTSFYTFFRCPPSGAGTEHLADCREWTYLKTSTPTGAGTPAQAFKFGPAPQAIVTAGDTKGAPKAALDLISELERITR